MPFAPETELYRKNSYEFLGYFSINKQEGYK